MALIPHKKIEKVSFFSSRITTWTTNATAIGTTSGAVTSLGTLVTSAQAAIAAQEAAENDAKAKTSAANSAVDAVVKAGGDIISAIRTKGRTVGGTSVYDLAQIPPPATPATKPPPGTPSALKTTLNPNGSLSLKFKCANPVGTQGTIYHVYRSLTGEPGTYEYLGGGGTKEFTDATCPAGVPMVYYSIQAVRSTAFGETSEFVVKFGSAAGPGTAKVYSSPKLAA